MSKSKRVRVEIEADVYDARTIFIRMDCGSAESEIGKFELSTSVDTGSPLVMLPDGRYVSFDWSALVRAADAAGGIDA